ncbi:MAG: hypothetical protein K6G46_11230 [Prevotella sp.]|nr:hypothetical protein [Prevotella sp.]
MKQDKRLTKRLQYTLFAVLLTLLSPQTLWAQSWPTFFTDVMVVGGGHHEIRYWQQGWNSYDQDLNKGAGGDYIYLLYKTASTQTESNFITNLKVVTSDNYPDSFTEDGVDWHLASYWGDSHFAGMKGDLNSNAGGKTIHLYYTRHQYTDNRVVCGVYFNGDSNGAVGGDLNEGAGGDYIYMHVRYANQGEGDFFSPSDAFTFNPNGRGCIHFKLLTSTWDPFRTLHDAVYSVVEADGTKTAIFSVKEQKSLTQNDYVTSNFQNNLSDESVLFLTNSVAYSPKYYLVTGNEVSMQYYRADGKGKASGNAYAELDWYYPARFAGKNLRLVVDATLYYDGGHTEPYSQELGTLDFDDTSLETYDAVLGTEAGEEGMVKIPCVSDHPINWLQATYTGDDGQEHKMDKIDLGTNSYAGFVLLPATDSHKKVTINAGITMSSWDKDKLGDPSWPTSNTNVFTLEVDNVPMMHDSRELRAEMDSQGRMILNWHISDVNYPDIVDTDQFLIQRSLTGKEDDFKDIGTVMLDIKQQDYTYCDSLLISSLKAEHIDKTLGIPAVRYRVLRASTPQLWGLSKNPTISHVLPSMATLTLLQPTNAKADWSNKEESKVLVTWDYWPNDQSHNFVWDNRAEMSLEINMFNRKGTFIGTTTMVLTAAQIAARQLEVTLHRSCAQYVMELMSDAKQSPIGQGTGNVYLQINSDNDLSTFRSRLDDGIRGVNAILTADVTTPYRLGPSTAPMDGIFNGNGHSITFNNSRAADHMAVFNYVEGNAVISNLRVKGTVNNGAHKYATGLVAYVKNGTLYIDNVISEVNISSTGSGDATNGGLVGHLEENSNVNISNSLFKGSINLDNRTSSGGFVGWHNNESMAIVSNSYYGGNGSTASECYTLVRGETEKMNFFKDCSYKNAFGAPQGRQSNSAPNNSCWKNGEPVLKQVKFSNCTTKTTYVVLTPDDNFYYENNGKLINNSLSATTLQSSVLLEWATDGGAIDYFIVERRDQAKSADSWETIATQITDTQYEDKTTAPMHTYDYRVKAANDCEGVSYQTTDIVAGHCFDYGTVEGYVRFPDGTGVVNLPVVITSTDGGSTTRTVKTDESGYFYCDKLPYWGSQKSGSYHVAPQLNGYSGYKAIDFGTEPGSNFINDLVFYLDNNVRFSGFVLYNGTSIPVLGVSFLVDGREVHNSDGKVTTDFEGQFSFRMLPGNHVIQAVKDGHVFYQDGYYYEGDDTSKKEHTFDIDKAGVYFYDNTRVKLIGRVAGGHVQEAFPLDNSLSHNNLGDDLQLVLTLEGDRSSRLVWDIQDDQLKERDEVFHHQSNDNDDYLTQVHTTINRMVVKPDVRTGEYQVWLPPTKWKIEQITARGYATLFQDGHTSDVIDLTDSLTLHTDIVKGQWRSKSGKDLTEAVVKYHAIYNRIYHAPVNIDYKQIGYDNFDYLGNHYYTAKGLDGSSVKVELVRPVRKAGWPAGRKDSLTADYTFGYPVFNVERSYPLRLSATEKYYYNNSQSADSLDVVHLSGGRVTIQNGFVSSTHKEVIELDSIGEYLYQLKAAQIPYLITGEQALRTVTMTLEMDGTYYEASPIRAYILNIAPQAGAKDVISLGKPILVDILRDPPGASSSAKLSRGSTLTSTFTLDMKLQSGVKIDIGAGTSWDSWQGMGAGIWNKATNEFDINLDLVYNNNSQLAFNYTMTANSDISTSSSKLVIGADGDVYIGINTNVIVKPAIAIRAINDSIYQTMLGAEKAGRLLVIAQGTDSQTGKPLYLVRSETMAVGQDIQSSFVHSQHYITSQLLPQLEEQCRALMFTGTQEEAQRLANATSKPVYLSLRDKDDPMFAVVNTREAVVPGQAEWEVFYNNSIFKAEDGVNYVIIEPSGMKNEIDEVADYYQSMLYWAAMVAQNESEKLQATELMKNFDVDGAMGMNYSEEFSSQYTATHSETDITTNFRYGNAYTDILNGLGLLYNSVFATMGKFAINQLFQDILKKTGNGGKKDENPQTGEILMTGWKWNISIVPVISCDFTPKYGATEKFTRKESFNIAMDVNSHLNFDVFYANAIGSTTGQKDWNDVFVNDNFNTYDAKVVQSIFNSLSNLRDNTKHSRGFIYRTRGGATQRFWEDQRTTQFYNIGAVLDERTKKIENPVIKMDKQSLSGVPFDQPARFKVYMTNDSEQPEAAYPFFTIMLVDESNPHGAKVMMDGMPLTYSPRLVMMEPGQVLEKTIEVYASEVFDYEDLRIRLGSEDDFFTYQDATFSVHYLQTAGNVSITSPGDKWMMNTDAPYDSIHGWYLPVIISDFNRNQHNFDHIEFQYKESSRGDDYWTNLCSFYADSTYYKGASGTKEMIPANGNITTKFFGEGVVMEKGYDLRAVLFCRNGNGYITNASKVLSGVKDTRRPQLFGNPEPTGGVLEAGDNIIFNFSEDIEYNYLKAATNFEVKGETNETVIQENSALLFGGNGYAESEVRRNFNDKNITVEVMIKPDNTGRDMPIFSHGTDGSKLQLWLTKDRRLRAVVNDRSVEGKTQIDPDVFTRVAMTLDSEQHTCKLYADALEGQLDSVTYTSTSTLIFGASNQADVSKRSFYQGRMLQGRIWNRTMDLILLNNYGNKLLTGYEMGLTDYYPMNEGNGNVVVDGAQGADLYLNNVSWSLPHSMSLLLDRKVQQEDGTQGLKLKKDFFTRDADQDYTLMFWFKTDDNGRGALLSNGSGRATDVEQADRFFIGFETDSLKYRVNGQEYYLGNHYSDNQWHHYAMTMNKAQQVANIYVDFKPVSSFSTEQIGGMGGDHFYLGNMVWTEQGADNDKLHQANAFTGHIDGLTLFEQALPQSLINRYGVKGLGGEEMGLITYLDFCRQERQKDGELLLVPYVRNKVIKRDQDGNISERNDTVFVLHADKVLQYVDHQDGAPIQAYEQLHELNFSFVGSGHQLLVNIDELDSRINKRRVYATISDIPDLNGNITASPTTVSLFIDRNPLRWKKKTYNAGSVEYGSENVFSLNIYNNSGSNHVYTIDNLPKWLKVNVPTDAIGPEEERELHFTVSKDANVGSYDHIIYVTDEDGLAEPLPLTVEVTGNQPEWIPDEEHSQYSMNIIGRIQIKDEIVTDSRDIVGVFDTNGTCLGVNHVDYDDTRAESLAYITAYEDSVAVGHPLVFKLWHCQTGKVMVLTPSESISFKPNGTIGTTKNPIVLRADDQYIQELLLLKGWNWVSFNVNSSDFSQGKTILDHYSWADGDMVIDDNTNLALRYHQSQWISNKGSKGLDNFKLSIYNSYRIKSDNPKTIEVLGNILSKSAERTLTIKHGWNNIGYSPMLNLPVSTALADYFNEAEDGDVIKSRSEFAMMTVGANGTKEWKGNLRYMKPGEGYMLYRKNQTETSFTYPFYEPNSTFFEGANSTTAMAPAIYAHTMSLTATIEGIELEPGDKLTALSGAEVVGETLIGGQSEEILYLSICGDKPQTVSFALERNGEVMAVTDEILAYKNNAISGTPDSPTVISFVRSELLPQTGWYTVQGIKLPGRPTKSGVYIYNGKKQVIK